MNSVKSGRYSEYGTPPPFRKHSTILGSRAASMGRPWLLAARLRLDVPVRQTACSGGRENVREAASYSKTPPADIALVEARPGGDLLAPARPFAAASKSPVVWPMSTINVRTPLV